MNSIAPLQTTENSGKVAGIPQDVGLMDRKQMETLHFLLLGAIQQLRRNLGLPPLLTGKEQRRQERK
jgi:hypothetical protein